MKKTYILVALVVVLIIAVVGFNKADNGAKNSSTNVLVPATEIKHIKIGLAAGLTGYAAEWGEGELGATKLIIDEFNANSKKITIDLIVENTKSDAVGTVNAIKKLIEVDKVEAIIGPTWGDSFQGGFPLATKAKVWTISPSSAIETLGASKAEYPYLLSLWWPQKDEMNAMGVFLKDKGYKNIAVVTDKDAFNIQYGNDFAKLTPQYGLQISSVESTPIGTTDFRTIIAKLKNQKPDAVLVLMQDTAQLGPFNKQVKEIGLRSSSGDFSKIVSTASAENQSNLDKFPDLFNGVYYTFPKVEEGDLYNKYLEKYKATNTGKSTGPAFVNALNSALALVTAIDMREDQGREGMLQVDKVCTDGIGIKQISFNSNGQIEKSEFLIKTIENNKFVTAK